MFSFLFVVAVGLNFQKGLGFNLAFAYSDSSVSARYFSFNEVDIVVPEGNLTFLNNLKWSGMVLVGAPSLKRIHYLYGYSSQDLDDLICQNKDSADSKFALILDWRVSVENRNLRAVYERLRATNHSFRAEDSLLKTPGAWVKPSHIIDQWNINSASEGIRRMAQTVEREILWNSACDLREEIQEATDRGWNLAENIISEGLLNDMVSQKLEIKPSVWNKFLHIEFLDHEYMFLTNKQLEGIEPNVRYIVECKQAPEKYESNSLCAQ